MSSNGHTDWVHADELKINRKNVILLKLDTYYICFIYGFLVKLLFCCCDWITEIGWDDMNVDSKFMII